MGDQEDNFDSRQSVLPCTVSNILRVFKETRFRCNYRLLGSQLGLTTQDLDDYDKENEKYPAREHLHQLLDKCSQRGLLDWKHIIDTLKKPALEQCGRETVSKIVSEHCRRGSSASIQSALLSPVSVTSTSDSNPFEKSISLESPMEEESELTIPNVVNRIFSHPIAVDGLRKLADSLCVKMDMKYDTKDTAENIQRMVEEWFHQGGQSWEALETTLRDAHIRAPSDARSSESNSDVVDASCVKKAAGILTIDDLQHVLNLIWDSRNEWRNLGIELNIQKSNLESIGIKERDNPRNCFSEMIAEWLRSGNATWTKLASALEAKPVNHKELAKKVRKTTGEALVASGNSNTQTKSFYGEEKALIEPTSNQDQVEVSFQCPCSKCTLASYLNGDCSKQNSFTYPYLNIKYLSEVERDDLIQKLDDDTDEIRFKFAELCNTLSDSLKNREKPVSTNELVKVIVSIDKSQYADLIKSIDIDAVFIVLHKQVSFFNYEIIKYIVKRLGDAKDSERLELYIKSFEEFCKRRIFEVSPRVYGSTQRTHERKLFILAFETELHPSLTEVKRIQRKIAKLLNIKPSSNLHVECIDEGCLIVVFSIPNFIAQEIFPLDQRTLCELKAQGFTLFIPNDYTSLEPELRQASWQLPTAEDTSESTLPGVLASKYDFDQKIIELWKRFSVLFHTTKAELTLKNKSVVMLKKKHNKPQMPCSVNIKHYKHILHLINCKHRHFQDTEEIFLYMNMYCWNCFQYKLLREVIKINNCSHALTARMESFERDIAELRQRSKISEFINSAEPSIRIKQNLLPPHFTLVTTEHDIDPDEQKLITLDSFCEDISTNFDLQAEYAFQMVMIDLKQGRTVVEWIIPHELLEVVTTLFCDEVGQAILMEHHIKDVIIDGRSVMERWALKRLLDTFDEESPIDEKIFQYIKNVNTCSKMGKTFLSIAAGYGRMDIMELLLKHGAYVDHPNEDEDGDTPLMVACDWGQLSAAERLIGEKADVNYQTRSGWTPLLRASDGGHSQVVDPLVKAGALVDFPNMEGQTALLIACLNGYLDTVNKLLRAGAQCNWQDQNGLTGLILATQNGYQEIVQTLMSNGADPNITETKYGKSAIFFAAEHNCIDIIQVLIEWGAKVDLKDKSNETVLDVVKRRDYPYVYQELLKHVPSKTTKPEGQKSSKKKSNWNALKEIFDPIMKSLLRGRHEKRNYKKHRRAILIGETNSDVKQQLTVKEKAKTRHGVNIFATKVFRLQAH